MPFGSQNKLTIGTNFRYWRNSFSSSSSLVKVHRSLESGHGTTTSTGSNARSFGSWLYAGWPPRRCSAVTRRRIFHDTSPSSLPRGWARSAAATSSCGAEEIRTPDLLLAKETLYQLSHGPRGRARSGTFQKGAVSIAAMLGFLNPNRGGRFWTRTRDLCLI